MITRFIAHTGPEALNDLRLRLNSVRWPAGIHKEGWQTGADTAYMKELCEYWLDSFSWYKTEAETNAWPNFIAEIDGYQIHFLHIRSNNSDAMPLIITHGWPGSFIEMLKLIPLLTKGDDISFHLVIPSLPGFGYSGKPAAPGCNSATIADLWVRLMRELGYERFAAQGGDIGAGVSSWLGLNHPGSILGIHLNYIPGSYKPYFAENEQIPDEILQFQQVAAEWSAKEGAYAAIHSSKPTTVAYGLSDSPVGLAAWIIEKFRTWSDNDGNPEDVFTKDELLSNISLYWLSNTIHSSMQLYHENSMRPLHLNEGDFIKPPVAFAKFPKELPTPPRTWIEKGYNIQRWTEMPAGGHFAAMEQPMLLAADIKAFFLGLKHISS